MSPHRLLVPQCVTRPRSSCFGRRNGLVLLIVFIAGCLAASGQTIPPDRDGLEKGEGMGMGLYGEINGYPGPKHVLELKDSLNLSTEQTAKAQAIFDEMRQQSTALGRTIISMEEKFNNAFRSGEISEDSLLLVSTSIGQLRGQLRAVHLRAHLLTRDVLNEAQLMKYMRLRGHSMEKHEHH